MTPELHNHIVMLFFFVWFLHEFASCLKVDKSIAFISTSSLVALEISSRYREEGTPAALYCPYWNQQEVILHLPLLLSRFSRVRLCVTPKTEAHHAPPSPGFSRQEHWSGLPFPFTFILHGCVLSHFSRVPLCAIP